MDYLTRLAKYYGETFDKVVKGISSHSEFTIEDAEDVIQDGMVKAIVAISNGHTLRDIDTFFMRHVTQARINHYNRYIMRRAPITDEDELLEQDPEDFLDNLSHFELTKNQEQILILRLRGYFDTEIANYLGVSSMSIGLFLKALAERVDIGGRVAPLSSI